MQFMRQGLWFLLGLCCLSYSLVSYGQSALKDNVDWSYHGVTGPDAWGYLTPLYQLCKTSQIQSPINIDPSKTISGHDDSLTFHYRASPFVLDKGTHNLYIGLDQNWREDYVSLDNKKYYLSQVHFHVPAEHTIDNNRSAMEAHLVHTDLDGHLLVVAVLMDVGEPSTFLTDLFDKPFFTKEQYNMTKVSLSAQDLLPDSRKYYTYVGSLTSPPCSEPVRWIVLKQPMSLSKSQLAYFKRHVTPYNSRPAQPINKRRVFSF